MLSLYLHVSVCVCVSFSRIRIPQIEFVIHFIWIYKRKPCWDVITNLKFSENEMQRACDWSAIHTHLMIALLADVLVLVATIWIKVKCVRVWWTDLQILIFDRLNWKSSAFAAICIIHRLKWMITNAGERKRNPSRLSSNICSNYWNNGSVFLHYIYDKLMRSTSALLPTKAAWLIWIRCSFVCILFAIVHAHFHA